MRTLLLLALALGLQSCASSKKKLEEKPVEPVEISSMEQAVVVYMNECLATVEKPNFERISADKLVVQFEYISRFNECHIALKDLVQRTLKENLSPEDYSSLEQQSYNEEIHREKGARIDPSLKEQEKKKVKKKSK